MPPRRRRAAAAPVGPSLCSLPQPLALRILALLPVDTRLRCREVSRGWRDLAAEKSLWRCLDFGPLSCVSRPVSEGLFRAAVARARGGMEELDVSGCRFDTEAICAALRANPGLTTLTLYADLDENPIMKRHEKRKLRDLLRAIPGLRELRADVRCVGDRAAPLLRGEGPWAPLRLRALRLESFPPDYLEALRPELESAAVQPSLQELVFCSCGDITREALDLIAEFAVARALPALRFQNCTIQAQCVPALAHAVAVGSLTRLVLDEGLLLPYRWFWTDEAACEAFTAALRANQTLNTLALREIDLGVRPAATVESVARVLNALQAHPSLQSLTISLNRGRAFEPTLRRAVAERLGAALKQLLEADSPMLTCLDVHGCDLGDTGLAHLVAGLRSNTHLRELRLGDNGMSCGFVRKELLPAVRANSGLRTLTVDHPLAAAHKVLARRS